MLPIVSFKNFNFTYRNLSEPTLKNINLDIFPGEKVLIAGPSGSGKSTLAHCINGLIPFSYEGEIAGNLWINGIKPYKTSIFEISKIVGTILQDQDAQFIGLSVGEDVAFAFENDMVPQEKMRKEVRRAAKMVEMLGMLEQSPYELSGGQKQRVSLAGILTTNTPILLFDEPLANLDPASGRKVMELIHDIHRQTNKTIIIIEHHIEDVLEQSVDRVIVMDQGEIKAIGTPDEILSTGILRRTGLREPLYIEALNYAKCEWDASDKVSSIQNINKAKFKEALNSWYEKSEQNEKNMNAANILSLKHVHFSYDGVHEVLKGISLDIYEGEIVSLLGNNGAGKSTISNLITGISVPAKGDIYLGNERINDWSVRERGQRIGYVMQNPNQMITQHMVKDEISLGLVAQGFRPDIINQRVEKVLKMCGLYPYRNWPISALSYGQKKRVTIASILVLEPRMIILDEPTAGQDWKHYTEFMRLIQTLSERGIAFLLITHDMHLALEYTNRAIVLSAGRVIADDEAADVLTNKEVIQKANLKETSLSILADVLRVEHSKDFVRHFINYEKMVKYT
ncbi:MAG TPA: ABC transporter ATP-binding protein [Bacillus sp. (in: firmicutes)]|nr:ABC transporter ATP-binding protein [Bacillus sp. (in: firmicutes)]